MMTTDEIGIKMKEESGLRAYSILDTPISATTIDEVCHKVECWRNDERGRFICIRDVASLMTIRNNRDLRELHNDASIVTPDGMPLVLLGKLKGNAVERVCGPDLMEVLIKRSSTSGLKHYLYGGKDGVAQKIIEKFEAELGMNCIVGYETPPFRPPSSDEQIRTIEKIRKSGADVVWVGLSSPKQDVWMWENYRSLSQTLIGVGAAFDFHSGSVKRAPKWMQSLCLEWLYRLMQEPRRLYRRYLVLAPLFLFSLVYEKFK